MALTPAPMSMWIVNSQQIAISFEPGEVECRRIEIGIGIGVGFGLRHWLEALALAIDSAFSVTFTFAIWL